MWLWWNSLESVSKIHSWLQLVAAVFGVLTAILIFLAWITGNRITSLQAKRETEAEKRLKTAEQATFSLQDELGKAKQRQVEAEAALRKRLDEEAERQRPRSLSSEQRILFMKMLSASPKVVVEIESPADDKEAAGFAGEIAKLLNQSGWKISAFARAQYPNGVNPRGIEIGVLAESQRQSANAIKQAFEAVGFSVKTSFSQNTPPPPMRIVIGSKP